MKNLFLIALSVVAFNLNAQNINVKAIAQSPLCHGAATGSISLILDGGTAPFTFLWSTGETTSSISSLVAGTYTVTVDDNAGLITSTSIKISEPDQLSLSGFVVNVTTPGGNDGQINLTVGGGTHDYFYAWDNGATSEDIGGLVAGDYSVVVTDGFGCTASLTKTVSEMPQLPYGGIGNTHLNNNGGNGNRSLNAPNGTTNNNMNIGLYPNPASNFLSVKLKGEGESQISVINTNGQTVLAQKFSSETPMVDVSNLPNGNYIVSVKTATETTSKNIVIAK